MELLAAQRLEVLHTLGTVTLRAEGGTLPESNASK